MESKKKKKLLNGIMVLLILVIAASGVLTVGSLRGWFDRAEDAVVTSGVIKGSANIERKGIGYALNTDMTLQKEDIIETKKGAQAEICLKTNRSIWLSGNTEVILTDCVDEQIGIQIEEGDLFGDTTADTSAVQITFAGNQAALAEAVFSVSVQAGSCQLNLYAGDISVILEDGTQERVEAGETLSVVNTADDSIEYQINEIQIQSLSEFLIAQLQSCTSTAELCFGAEQLQQVLDDRAAEKQAALEASLNAQTVAASDETEAESELTSETTAGDTAENQAAQEEENYVVEEQQVQKQSNICTISILCDTILDNMENLDDGKEAYVPANGTILATSSVEFEEGETVFDVLKRVCEYAGIQLEYSWTAIYDSYYIEGINNLYEFDCGNESGWMYKVNGWFPNYGCSSYELADGDNIVWCYTCNGLGADVGGPVY